MGWRMRGGHFLLAVPRRRLSSAPNIRDSSSSARESGSARVFVWAVLAGSFAAVAGGRRGLPFALRAAAVIATPRRLGQGIINNTGMVDRGVLRSAVSLRSPSRPDSPRMCLAPASNLQSGQHGGPIPATHHQPHAIHQREAIFSAAERRALAYALQIHDRRAVDARERRPRQLLL